jgi:hypothetical protein
VTFAYSCPYRDDQDGPDDPDIQDDQACPFPLPFPFPFPYWGQTQELCQVVDDPCVAADHAGRAEMGAVGVVGVVDVVDVKYVAVVIGAGPVFSTGTPGLKRWQ